MKFGKFMQYYKLIFFKKKFYEKYSVKKDSVEVSMLIQTNFDRSATTYLIWVSILLWDFDPAGILNLGDLCMLGQIALQVKSGVIIYRGEAAPQ